MSEGTSYCETMQESPDTTLVKKQLLESLMDVDYRREFVRERVRSSVALQTRALREQRGMTQKDLGDAIGMKQTWVSKLENPEYGKMTMETLLRLADAYDTDLEIKFRPFSRLLDELPNQGPWYYSVASFSEEFEHPVEAEECSEVLVSLVDAHEITTVPKKLPASAPDTHAGAGETELDSTLYARQN